MIERIGVDEHDEDSFSVPIKYQFSFKISGGVDGMMNDIYYTLGMENGKSLLELFENGSTATYSDCKKEMLALYTEQFKWELSEFIDSHYKKKVV